MNPVDNAAEFACLQIGDQISPGVMKIVGLSRKLVVDIVEAKGQNGASTTRQGKKVCVFKCEFHLIVGTKIYDDGVELDVDEFELFEEFMPILRATQEPDALAVSVYHPEFLRLGVRNVMLTDEGAFEPDEKGGGKVFIELTEYYKKKPVNSSTPNGSKKDKYDDEIDKRKKELDSLLNNGGP